MNSNLRQRKKNENYLRLVALWVLIESFLGGILHGLKIPVTGLLVGGSAMICIILIARNFPTRGSILKAMTVVAVFKLMLSPHSPPAAYLAVFFQGLLGEFLLRTRRFFLPACLLFGVLTMLESAFQRILVLMILYGNEFWKAFDQWLVKTTGEGYFTDFSLTLATGYVLLHLLAGLVIAGYAWKLSVWRPVDIPETWKLPQDQPDHEMPSVIPIQQKRKRVFSFLWLVVLVLCLLSIFFPDSAILPRGKIVALLVRFALIISFWKLALEPVLDRILVHWLRNQQGKLAETLSAMHQLLPGIYTMILQSWNRSGRGTGRVKRFVKILVYNLLFHETA